jgi:hypothetical protein
MVSVAFVFAIVFIVVGTMYTAYRLVSGFSQFLRDEKNRSSVI